MTESEQSPEIAGAEAYQALMVPALFAEWAPRVANAARIRPGQRVLDVACGTGVLALELAERVGSPALVTGVDAGSGMLEVAAHLAPRICWRRGMAEVLPFADDSFDAVVSQFGLMFFGDPHRALEEIRRVLAPGGSWAVAVWDSLAHTPAYAAEHAVLEEMAGAEAAAALAAPFVLGDPQQLRRLFTDAGFTELEVTTVRGSGHFPSVRVMVEADLRGWLPLMGVELEEDLIQAIVGEAERRLQPFVAPDGQVQFDSPAHIVHGAV